MAFFTAASKADFQHQLQAVLAQHVDEHALPQVALFADQFFGIISLDELTQRRLSDLAGCTLSAWRLMQRFKPQQPEVRVYNPDYERHGWQSTHSVVEVLHEDLPFLVDSVRTELNRRGYSIHTLQTAVLSVRRGPAGELLEVLPKNTRGDGVAQESLMYLEIDRCATASGLAGLSSALLEVLGEVRATVADFDPMKAKLHDMLALVDNSPWPVDGAEKAEVKVFLEWLVDNHFTFLGYEEFEVHGTPKAVTWCMTSSPSWACRGCCAPGSPPKTCVSRTLPSNTCASRCCCHSPRLPSPAVCIARPTLTMCPSGRSTPKAA